MVAIDAGRAWERHAETAQVLSEDLVEVWVSSGRGVHGLGILWRLWTLPVCFALSSKHEKPQRLRVRLFGQQLSPWLIMLDSLDGDTNLVEV
jgi:hypothetical protein